MEVGWVVGGGGGIRTPGPLRVGGFQDRCLKPLGHPSGCPQTTKKFLALKSPITRETQGYGFPEPELASLAFKLLIFIIYRIPMSMNTAEDNTYYER